MRTNLTEKKYKLRLPTIYIIYGGRGLGRSSPGRFLLAAWADKFVVVKPATKSYIQR